MNNVKMIRIYSTPLPLSIGVKNLKPTKIEVVLVHCNLVKDDYQHISKVLFTFVPNKQFGQLINISPRSLTIMNTINTEFSSVEV